MLFDCDTHCSPFRHLPVSMNAEEWDARMAGAGIDKAVCWLMQQHLDGVEESNKYIYESARKHSRMVPFGWVMLGRGLEKALKETDRCLDEYGFYGIKINGAQNEHNIDSDETMQIIERIAKNGKSVAFHIGADSPDYTNPIRAAKVAKRFPEINVIMVHMGGAADPDVSAHVIEVARECPNMMLVGSSIKLEKVADAVRELGPERIMFGSDTPYHEPAAELLAAYRKMLKEFDPNAANLVLGENAKRIFKL